MVSAILGILIAQFICNSIRKNFFKNSPRIRDKSLD